MKYIKIILAVFVIYYAVFLVLPIVMGNTNFAVSLDFFWEPIPRLFLTLYISILFGLITAPVSIALLVLNYQAVFMLLAIVLISLGINLIAAHVLKRNKWRFGAKLYKWYAIIALLTAPIAMEYLNQTGISDGFGFFIMAPSFIFAITFGVMSFIFTRRAKKDEVHV